jgi:hypothetical protein
MGKITVGRVTRNLKTLPQNSIVLLPPKAVGSIHVDTTAVSEPEPLKR